MVYVKLVDEETLHSVSAHLVGGCQPWTGVNCRFSLPQLPFCESQFLHLRNEGPGWNQISRSFPGVEVPRRGSPTGVALFCCAFLLPGMH